MTKANFISRGKQYLDIAETIEDANRSMRKSCFCCAQQNFSSNCDTCAIKEYHDIVVSAMKIAQDAYQRKRKPWVSLNGNTMRFF